jgi:hypothetical protein
MYAMNIQNDVIGLVLRQNCKSKQVTDFIIMLVKYVSIDGIPQAFVSFRFVDIIVITVHDRFWNVGQANYISKYFENMMIFFNIMWGQFCTLTPLPLLIIAVKLILFLSSL